MRVGSLQTCFFFFFDRLGLNTEQVTQDLQEGIRWQIYNDLAMWVSALYTSWLFRGQVLMKMFSLTEKRLKVGISSSTFFFLWWWMSFRLVISHPPFSLPEMIWCGPHYVTCRADVQPFSRSTSQQHSLWVLSVHVTIQQLLFYF